MQTLKNKCVLFVDDEVQLTELLSLIFTAHGARTWTANNGEEALRILRNEEVHLIISDVRMPGGSGPELFQKIFTEFTTPPIFFLMTGFPSFNDHEIKQNLGVKEIILKPFDFEQLIALAAKYLNEESILPAYEH